VLKQKKKYHRDFTNLFNLQLAVQTLFSISVPRCPRVWVSNMTDCECQTHIHFPIALARRYGNKFICQLVQTFRPTIVQIKLFSNYQKALGVIYKSLPAGLGVGQSTRKSGSCCVWIAPVVCMPY